MNATAEIKETKKVENTQAVENQTKVTTGGDDRKEKKVKKGPKPQPIPASRMEDISDKKPLIIRFHVPKDQIATVKIPAGGKNKFDTVHHLYVPLATWFGRVLPDQVNVRSHEQNVLRNPVTEKIEETIKESPENFHLANLGLTVLADSFKYNDKSEIAEIKINDVALQGVANGGTSDLTIAKVQTDLARQYSEQRDIFYPDFINSISQGEKIDFSKVPENLLKAHVHLEIFVGIEDRERIYTLVEGRNTSRAVKPVSLAHFRDEFKFLENILEGPTSEIKGKIGYEENSRAKISILNVVSILTLMHKTWDEKDEAPTVSYSARGKLSNVLADNKLAPGYMALGPITLDILRLHDYLISKFPENYEKAFEGKSRLARRQGVKAYESARTLPFSGAKSEYSIPSGLIFPLLQSFRALIDYNGKGEAFFKISPFTMYDKYGPRLIKQLIENLVDEGNSPTQLGKKSRAYKNMHTFMKSLVAEELQK